MVYPAPVWSCPVVIRYSMPEIPRRPLAANAFRDLAGMTLFLKRRTYKIMMFLLLIVALSILAVNVAAALAMIFAVLFSFGSSYCSLAKTAKTGASAGYALLASQGLAGLVYVISLLFVISQSMTSSSSTSASNSYSASSTYFFPGSSS